MSAAEAHDEEASSIDPAIVSHVGYDDVLDEVNTRFTDGEHLVKLVASMSGKTLRKVVDGEEEGSLMVRFLAECRLRVIERIVEDEEMDSAPAPERRRIL